MDLQYMKIICSFTIVSLLKIKEMIANGSLGDIRLYRMSFGFPMRGQGEFSL